jgi:proteasome assembly chaperone (PAC2) family protein
MANDRLKIYKRPRLSSPRLLLGFSGWMDGGEVSTGTLKCFKERLGAEEFAQIEPEGFYIYSFPGSMEVSALFRPHTKIKDGLIESYRVPRNIFSCAEGSELILFSGKEPHCQWEAYAECIFSLCSQFGVKTIYFIGSVAGLVPHTREPRVYCSVSQQELKGDLHQYGIRFSDYEGPASIVTYLTAGCPQRGLNMVSLVAEIPAYIQGHNPKCIERLARRLSGMLKLQLHLDDLRTQGEEFEKKLNDVVQRQPELVKNIQKLEADYDSEVFDSEMGELKSWLEQQGIRVD